MRFAAKPRPPAGKPKVSDITFSSCQLEWDPPEDDGGSPVTSYFVEKLEISPGNEENEWRHLALVHVRHMLVRGLVTGVQYRFRVAAENFYGTSEMGEESDTITATGSLNSTTVGGMDYDSLGMSNVCLSLGGVDQIR